MIRTCYAATSLSLVVVFLLLLTGGLSAQVDGAYNTTPYDSLHPDPNAGGRYSALWGYTAPDGREYALLGGYNGTHIIDITEKPIRQVAFIPGPPNGWREMKTWGTTAYIVSEGGAGLQIVDLSGLPDTATLVKADTSAFRTGHTITQEGDWIYVHGMNVEAGYNQGTMIFEVATDPHNPVLVGGYTRGYVHDATIRNDTMYAAMINNGRLDIVYLGEGRTMSELVNEITYPGAGTHSSDVTGDGTYILTTDEIGATPKTMKVWDRSDVDDIVKVGDWTPAPDAIIHNVRVKGNLAYFAWYTAGTRIADISDPRNPVEVGFYDFHEGSGMSYTGNWEVYPYFESGKIIASSTANGLHVFTFNGSGIGSAAITVVDSLTGQPLEGVALELPELGRVEKTDINGRIFLSAAEGTTHFTASLLNYRQKEGEIPLLSSVSEIEIRLSPLRLHNVTVRISPTDRNLFPVDFSRPFAWDLTERPEGGMFTGETLELRLPVDSSYRLVIGAWGYHRETVTIPDGDDGDEVIVTLEPGYVDDAELDLGWSLGLPDDDGSAGFWERGVPVGLEVFFNGGSAMIEPPVDVTPDPGAQAFMTDIAPSPDIAPGLADVDTGRVTLTSPIFRGLSPTLSGRRISFHLWFTNDAVPFFPADDRLYVRLSNDAGRTWVDVVTLESALDDWTSFDIGIDEHLEPTDSMLFRIVVSDSLEQGWVEAGLDDFEVYDVFMPGVEETRGGLGLSGLSIQPQPMRGRGVLDLALPERIEALRIDIFNGIGERVVPVFSGDLSAGRHRFGLDVGGLTPGAYHLVLRDNAGNLRREPLLIVR